MSKIRVEICSGTACYVLGGSEILQVATCLPKKLATKVQISGVMCLDLCKNCDDQLKPPFVRINGKIFSPKNPKDFIRMVQEEVEANDTE